MARKLLRVLLIEDNPGDIRLIKEMLRDGGDTGIEVEFVDRLQSGIERLNQGDIRIVLLDLGLPDSHGLDTLARIYEQFPEIPIVILSGHSDEALAVEAVKRGAQDYLLKGVADEKLLIRSIRYAVERKQMETALVKARDQLERRVAERTCELIAANEQLRQEIVERKLALEALRQSEERFRAIFEGAQDLIFIKDLSLKYTHVNPAVERLFGLPASEFLGKGPESLYSPDECSSIRDIDLRVLQGEWIESVHTRKFKGQDMTFHEIRAPMRSHDGKIIGICGMSRDITDRTKTEAQPALTDPEYPSAAIRATLKQALHVAAGDSVILLLGESGSGKDYLARYIHQHSKRSTGPFFSINCAAVAPELAESELFGHERGAFTGAQNRKRGLLELAEGGTLLLNEIGELSLPLQAKLLTFLDTREITRVGGEKSISVHARLIAATNRDLESEMKRGEFRQDLYYRLNVFAIEVPPLRERREDIPIVAKEILSKLADELQLSHVPVIDSGVAAALMRYDWPGNVRELRNVIERALILWDGGAFDIGLPSTEPEQICSDWKHTVTFPEGRNLRDIVEELSRILCVEAVRRCEGNKKAAAGMLGIARDSLYRYLKEMPVGTK